MLDNISIFLGVIGGLAIFLYGIELLGSTLKKINLDKAKNLIHRCTKTPIKGIFAGTIATTVLYSSSVTIIILIAFVDSNLILLKNAIWVVVGSNLGTTVSSQIIAFRIGDYAAIGLLLGVLGVLLCKNEKIKLGANILLAISLIFYGLHLIEMSVIPYKDSQILRSWMMKLDRPLTGALIGGLITLIIQSSSATIGLTIMLASQGLLGLDGAIAIMLGAEIGTCSDTLIATLGRKKDALKLGIFHLVYNLGFVILGILLLTKLRDLTLYVSSEASIGRQIANAHLIFNLISAFSMLGIATLYQKIKKN
jgi:phosphate:Na+ symporter